MKKSALKKTLALAITGAMVASSLTGCGSAASAKSSKASEGSTVTNSSATATSSSKASSASSEKASSSVASNTASGEAGIASWKPFDENVTIEIPVYDRGVEGVPDVTNNYWTKWVQDNFGTPYNITVKYVGITRSDVLTDYSLLAAADTLPTLCFEYDYPKLTQWMNDGYLQPYDIEEFKQVAPTYWQNMVDSGADKYINVGDDDYFVYGMRSWWNTTYTFITFYREDWLKKVGIDEYPQTWAAKKEAMKKIMDAGIAEHPLGGQKIAGAGADQNHSYRTYPQDEVLWATTGDYNIPALSTEAQKTFLKRENEAYNLGLKDPEYSTIDAETAKAAFTNGKTFEYGGYISSTMDWLNALYANEPDADLGVVVCPGYVEDDDPTTGKSSTAYRAGNPFGGILGFSHSASADQVKAAMMYLEWLSQPENLKTMQYGIEGENYTVGEDGKPVMVADYNGDKKQGFNNNVDYWCFVNAVKSLGTIEDDIKAAVPQGIPEDFTQDIIDNYYGQVKVFDAGYANSDCLFSTAIEAEAENAQTLYANYAVYRDQLTMCKPEEFDALYDELSKKYLDDGYQEVIDGRKAAYDEGLSTHIK